MVSLLIIIPSKFDEYLSMFWWCLTERVLDPGFSDVNILGTQDDSILPSSSASVSQLTGSSLCVLDFGFLPWIACLLYWALVISPDSFLPHSYFPGDFPGSINKSGPHRATTFLELWISWVSEFSGTPLPIGFFVSSVDFLINSFIKDDDCACIPKS